MIASEDARLHLDRSMPERYWLWMTGIGGEGDIGLLRGEFGPSAAARLRIKLPTNIGGLTDDVCLYIMRRTQIYLDEGSTTSSACVRARVGRPRPP
ncbi:MAG: hypothetical protein H0V93_02925 [Euzebyales bacterium]|nr:hypothetical protein [Euzebyales bacterium]